MALINDAEDMHSDHHHHHHHSSHKKKFLHPNERDDRHHHPHRRHHHHHHQEQNSWKRPTDDEEQSIPKKQARTDEEEEEEVAEPVVNESKEDELISEENLLELRKQLIRAELAGDDVRFYSFIQSKKNNTHQSFDKMLRSINIVPLATLTEAFFEQSEPRLASSLALYPSF